MINDQTINANLAECIRKASHIGYSAYHNICSGTVTEVPWGTMDWILMTFLFAFALIGVCFLLSAVYFATKY